MSHPEKDKEIVPLLTGGAQKPGQGGVIVATQETSKAVDRAVAPGAAQESPEQKLNAQGLALLKAGEIGAFNMLRTKNPKWILDFFGINLSGADLSGVNLRQADLGGANLERTILREADLRKADLSIADLSGATLIGADLSEADLDRANLSEAILSGAILRGADFSDASLLGTYLERAHLGGAQNLTPRLLSRACLIGVIIEPDQRSILEEALNLIRQSVQVVEKK